MRFFWKNGKNTCTASPAAGHDLAAVEDVKAHMEEIKTYLRGHNLFDIFYGPYKEQETELLKRYMELAPRKDFEDILNALERFPYFESRRKGL